MSSKYSKIQVTLMHSVWKSLEIFLFPSLEKRWKPEENPDDFFEFQPLCNAPQNCTYFSFHFLYMHRPEVRRRLRTRDASKTTVVNKDFSGGLVIGHDDTLLISSRLAKKTWLNYRRKNVTFPPNHPSFGCSQANTTACLVWRFAPSSLMLSIRI